MDGLAARDVEVIVVCNGCGDNTAKVARKWGNPVHVIETPVSSKAHALNLGDQAARFFPRLYIDADVRISGDGVRRIAAVLATGNHLAAAPAMMMDYSAASWSVRAFYRVWTRLPYTKEGFMGTGAYALTEQGRHRFERFPDVIADDGYVRLLFSSSERVVVRECVSIVTAPASLSDLIKIKTRSRLGLYQLRREFPELFAREAATKQYGSATMEIVRAPGLWLSALPYLGVNLCSKWRARVQHRRAGEYLWERDESTRRTVRPEKVTGHNQDNRGDPMKGKPGLCRREG